jgi:release factor glutamine methyltransferase
MSSSLSCSSAPANHDLSPIVATLRAAGCVFAEEEALLLITEAATATDLSDMVTRRAAGLPLEHVLGWAEFCGLRITVDPGVFVPRRRTELLAQQAAALAARTTGRPPVVVDLCCGSGAVAAVLAAYLDPIELHAADIEPAAVRCARHNLHNGRVYEGDLYQALPQALRGGIDVLVANAPYVPTEAIELMPPEARFHEPRVALDGGSDGLDVLRRVIAEAPQWLTPGGSLLVETSALQAPLVVETFARHGLVVRSEACEELAATVVIATLPSSQPSFSNQR